MSDKFLDLYKTLSATHLEQDEEFATFVVELGMLPASVRYGVMERGHMRAYRGVVKSTTGEDFYFSWSPGADFRLIGVETETDKWEVQRLYKSCSLGFDLRKAEEPKEEDEETEKAAGGGAVGVAGNTSVPEEQAVQAQQQVDVHPAAAEGTTPDSPFVGRDWHSEKSVLTNGQQSWSKLDLIKGLGARLQATAPVLQPKLDALEVRYMKEVMGASDQQINKGYRLPARHKMAYESWKGSQLQQNLANLQQWVRKKGE